MAKLPCFALCLRLALVTLAVGHKKRCVDDYDSLKAGDDCTVRWKELSNGGPFLLPTQPALGYAWVHQLQEEHYSSNKDAEKELKKDRFPVVLGQGNFYLTDRHHHVASLQLSDDKDIFDLEMRIYVICDLRSSGSEIFWSKMQDLNYVFLQKRASPFALPVLARETDLPQSWTLNSFEDDLWRSLAGFASHVSDEKQRCYAKKCQEYFVDFQWGFAINKATEDIPSLWPSMAQQATFRSKLHALPYPSLKEVDLKAWQELGQLALPLCHSQRLQSLPLPPGYSSRILQGWSATPVPKDPSCDYSSCRARQKAKDERDLVVV